MGETCVHDYTYIADYTYVLWQCRTQISGGKKKLKRYCKSTGIMNVNWLFIAVGMHHFKKNLIGEN